MATSDISQTEFQARPETVGKRRWFEPRYIVEIFDGADEALAALDAVQPGLTCTAFQTLDWISCLYEELALARRGMPRLVVVSERETGNVVLVLPLVVVRRRRLRVAQFADLGVSDYCAPILGPVQLTKPKAIRRVWRAIKAALHDVHLIQFERMPAMIGDRENPLTKLNLVVASRQSGFRLDVDGTVDDFISSRGKKFRKESQRCDRVWQREGGGAFYQATSPEQIARVYSTMEEQQAIRHAELGTRYVLKRRAYRSFYERVAMDGTDTGLGYLCALESNGEIAATLFGVVQDKTFTMLRITFGGEKYAHFSPGRTIILQAMRHLNDQGITIFDLGIGDYEYKRRLGAEPRPLFELISAGGISTLPRAIVLRTTRSLSHVAWLRRMRDTVQGRPASPAR